MRGGRYVSPNGITTIGNHVAEWIDSVAIVLWDLDEIFISLGINCIKWDQIYGHSLELFWNRFAYERISLQFPNNVDVFINVDYFSFILVMDIHQIVLLHIRPILTC